MPTFELEESDFAGYIPDDSEFNADVIGVKLVEKSFKDDETGQPVKKVEFKFMLVDDDGPFDGQQIWGETPVKFNTHPDCKLRNWSCAIMGENLPVGYRLDTDLLQGRTCRVLVGLRDYKDKDGNAKQRNFIKDVRPSAEAQAKMMEADEEPF